MLRTMSRVVTTFAALHVLASAATAQKLWVIDKAGTGDFTDFPQLASPVVPGDGFIVKQGTYTNNMVIDGFPVTVFAEKGATVTITGSVIVRNNGGLPQPVVLEGLHSLPGSTAVHEVENNGGTGVWIEDCTLVGQPHGLLIETSDNVVLTRSTFRGGNGLWIDSSRVTIWETVAEALDQALAGAAGGHGLRVKGTSQVFAAGCAFTGGKGGAGGGPPSCSPAGAGGHGAFVDPQPPPPTPPLFEYWDVVFNRGVGGAVQQGCSGPQPDGMPLAGPGTGHPYSSVWIEDSGPEKFEVPPVSHPVTFVVQGQPGAGFDTKWFPQICAGGSMPPVLGRVVLCQLGIDGPGGTVGTPSGSFTWSEPNDPVSVEVKVAFVQAGYAYLLSPGVYTPILTSGPTAAIYHKCLPALGTCP